MKNIITNMRINKHFLKKTNAENIVKNLCGIQTQIFRYGLFSILLRSGVFSDYKNFFINWTLRGTLHTHTIDDLPVFLHENSESSYSKAILEDNSEISYERKKYFRDIIKNCIISGLSTRAEIISECFKYGLKDYEKNIIFNSWGGLLRNMAEKGEIIYSFSRQKKFLICPDFDPMPEENAKKIMLERYFKNYAPATIRDASYFFGWPQKIIRAFIKNEKPEYISYLGDKYYFLSRENYEKKSDYLILSGFDPFLIGYNKKYSIILEKSFIRKVYTLQGMIYPTIFFENDIVGTWRIDGKNINIEIFRNKKNFDESYVKKLISQITDFEINNFEFLYI